MSAKNSEAALRFSVEEKTPKYVQLLASFQEGADCGIQYMSGFFCVLMTHILDLIPLCLSTPNRNCCLAQTAVLVIELDISFIYGFYSYAFSRVKFPL